jgi:hypothetical protein
MVPPITVAFEGPRHDAHTRELARLVVRRLSVVADRLLTKKYSGKQTKCGLKPRTEAALTAGEALAERHLAQDDSYAFHDVESCIRRGNGVKQKSRATALIIIMTVSIARMVFSKPVQFV